MSAISCDHCLRRFAGQMIRMRRFPSVHFWARTRPASIVFPRPTSSARIAPLESGRFEREECRLDLMRIQIHLRVEKCAGELLGIGDRMPAAELMRKELGMIIA